MTRSLSAGLLATDSRSVAMKLAQINVGHRSRKDLGDLRILAASIGDVGLLHPIVVTPEGRLLGWTDVPVTVVDLYQVARGEGQENFVHKDLLPSEIVALKRAIELIERREARDRQGSRTDLCHSLTAAESQGDARDNVARYLRVGRTAIERAEAVVQAAEEDPDEYGRLADQMDRPGHQPYQRPVSSDCGRPNGGTAAKCNSIPKKSNAKRTCPRQHPWINRHSEWRGSAA